MGLLIDSSVIIALERNQLAPAGLRQQVDSEELFISAVTASELLHGLHRANSESRRARRSAFLDDVFDTYSVIAFDFAVARVHAAIWADLRQQGMMIGAHDLLIGATAVAHSLSLLTHNVREFRRIRGLNVMSWDLDG